MSVRRACQSSVTRWPRASISAATRLSSSSRISCGVFSTSSPTIQATSMRDAGVDRRGTRSTRRSMGPGCATALGGVGVRGEQRPRRCPPEQRRGHSLSPYLRTLGPGADIAASCPRTGELLQPVGSTGVAVAQTVWSTQNGRTQTLCSSQVEESGSCCVWGVADCGRTTGSARALLAQTVPPPRRGATHPPERPPPADARSAGQGRFWLQVMHIDPTWQ